MGRARLRAPDLAPPRITAASPRTTLPQRPIVLCGGGDAWSVLSGLNSRADRYLADLERFQAPVWEGILASMRALELAQTGDLRATSPEGFRFRMVRRPAQLAVRPRGWHLIEGHVRLDGRPVPAGLFDLAVVLAHTDVRAAEGLSPITVHLGGVDGADEGRLWNAVIAFAERELGWPSRTVGVTLAIETVGALAEADELMDALSPRLHGIATHRWPYLFSRSEAAVQRSDGGRVPSERPEEIVRDYEATVRRRARARGLLVIGEPGFRVGNPWDERGVELLARTPDPAWFDRASDGVEVTEVSWVLPARHALDAPDDRLEGRAPVPARLSTLPDPGVHPTPEALERSTRVAAAVFLAFLQAWLQGHGTGVWQGARVDASMAEYARALLWRSYHDAAAAGSRGARSVTDAIERARAELVLGASTAQEFAADRAADLLRELLGEPEFVESFVFRSYDDLDRSFQTVGGTELADG